MATRPSPAKSTRNGSANTMPRSSGVTAHGKQAARSPSWPAGFDARNLPSLDPKDFQWGTPTGAQQQQLYSQYMQMSFMYASMHSPMGGPPGWPMMMPACPMPYPGAFHPGVFASCPPSGFLPPVMAHVAVPPPTSMQQVGTPAAPQTPAAAAAAKPSAKGKEQQRPVALSRLPSNASRLSRLPSDVSDTTECHSGMGGTMEQDAASAGRVGRTAQQQQRRDGAASGRGASMGPPAGQQPPQQQQQPPCAMQLSVDELQMLFADDSFLVLEELDTCSADEGGSRHLSHSSNGASPTGSSLASASMAGGSSGSFLRGGSGGGGGGTLGGQSLMHTTSVSEIDPRLFAVDGDGDDDDDVVGLPQHFGGSGGLQRGGEVDFDGAFGMAEEASCAPPSVPATPLRFPPHKTGLRKPRRATSSSFAALAAHLMPSGDDTVGLLASDSHQLQVVPDRLAKPAAAAAAAAAPPLALPAGIRKGGAAASASSAPALGRLSGGVRKTRSSGSLAAASRPRSRSPAPISLADLEPLASLDDGLLGCGASDRCCDDWDAVMFMDLDSELNPLDAMVV